MYLLFPADGDKLLLDSVTRYIWWQRLPKKDSGRDFSDIGNNTTLC